VGVEPFKIDSERGKFTAEIKGKALDAGATLVGIVSANAIDSLPPIWVGWTIKEYTKKTTDLMPDAKSVIVIGFHIWDDVLEIALRKDDDWVYPCYSPLWDIPLRISHHLETKGYEAVSTSSLSKKRLAQLAGFGAYGKNALIINPKYGPWIRLGSIVTNAELVPDQPFEQDLCGDCDNCLKVCPAGALTPYKIDDSKCLVRVHLSGSAEEIDKNKGLLRRFEPSLTQNAHLMCMECQKVCKYGKRT